MIIGIDFLKQSEVSILPYLRTLAFIKKGASTKHNGEGEWLEESYNEFAKHQESLGFRQD